MYEPLDGPSIQGKISSIGTGTVVEAKVGPSRFNDRKVVTIQPSSNIYIYFGDGTTTPNAATVIAGGMIVYKNAKETYEAGDRQPIFMLAVAGTANVVVVERA